MSQSQPGSRLTGIGYGRTDDAKAVGFHFGGRDDLPPPLRSDQAAGKALPERRLPLKSATSCGRFPDRPFLNSTFQILCNGIDHQRGYAVRTLEDNNDGPDEQHRANVGVALVHLNTSEDEPGDVADRMRLGQSFSETTGNPLPPLPVMKGNEALFQQAIDDKLNATILQQAPRLAGWLAADPTNAALAKDSVHDLAWWEKHAQDATSGSGLFADGTTTAASGPSPAFAGAAAPATPQAIPGEPFPNVTVVKSARSQPLPGGPGPDGTVAGGSGQTPAAPADADLPAASQAVVGEPYPNVAVEKSARSQAVPGRPGFDGTVAGGSSSRQQHPPASFIQT
jgi:hypothetical protein